MSFKLLTITDIIEKHKGKPAIIECHGPSANKNRLHINKICEENNFIIIAINEWHEFKNRLKPHYWVRSFPQRPSIGEDYDYFNKHTQGDIPLLSCDVTDKTTLEDAMKHLTCPYIPFDIRHFNRKTCEENYRADSENFLPRYFKFFNDCCNRRGRLTLQEQVKKYTKSDKVYSPSTHTSSIHMIAFAILMGCNPIYINGMDLDYEDASGRYAEIKDGGNVDGNSNHHWAGWRQNWITRDFEIINNSANNIGVKIINLHKAPWYKIFELGTL